MFDQSVIQKLHAHVISELELRGIQDIDKEVIEKISQEILSSQNIYVEEYEIPEIIRIIVDKMIAWGPLTAYLQDPTVSEIMINGLQSFFIERSGKILQEAVCFHSEDEIVHIISRMVGKIGRRIDSSCPFVDARLADGSRINAIIAPISLIGPILTIRKFPEKVLLLEDLLKKETVNEPMLHFLQSAVLAKQNIVISGGTGSGKTTTLNAISSAIPSYERIITIEDAAEMKLPCPHVISLEARMANMEGKGEIPIRVLLKNALRMRPDRIIVGEIRGGEALDMLQAMNTGHQGSLTTVHANSPLDALLRIETMALMTDIDLPLSAIRAQMKQAINIVVHQERAADGTRRIIAISELIQDDTATISEYTLKPLFIFNKKYNTFTGMGSLPKSQKTYSEHGVYLDAHWFEQTI